MCAGVQKLSRPMERCQATSHAPPMVDEVIAAMPVQMYQGTPLVCVAETGTVAALVAERGT